uniref:Uncharacterized protein n=1 Tax=Cacopsylla melanoneura TaxID=428564 RepID=A0A8D9BKI1_9HEMI
MWEEKNQMSGYRTHDPGLLLPVSSKSDLKIVRYLRVRAHELYVRACARCTVSSKTEKDTEIPSGRFYIQHREHSKISSQFGKADQETFIAHEIHISACGVLKFLVDPLTPKPNAYINMQAYTKPMEGEHTVFQHPHNNKAVFDWSTQSSQSFPQNFFKIG